jgi:Leucine-rich repeat (LRR) protein
MSFDVFIVFSLFLTELMKDMKSGTNVDNKLSLILRFAILMQSLALRLCSEPSLRTQSSLVNRVINSEVLPKPLPQFVSEAIPQTQSLSLSSLALSSITPPERKASNESNGCSPLMSDPICSCYALDEGLLIDCKITAIYQMTDVLNSLISQPIKSFSVYSVNHSLNSLPETLFQNFSTIEQIYISLPSLVEVGSQSLSGLETSLKTLSLVNSQLKSVPKTALNRLKSLSALDLQSNAIREVESYAFYGLPLVSLNLQSNLIHSLHEFSFGGLENSLVELVLIDNRLERFPLHAFRRLRRLETLKLQSNRISEIPDDGFTRFTVLKILDLQSNRFDHLDGRSFITTPNLVSLSVANNRLTVVSDSSIFEDLLALETLDLSYNRLRVVDLNNLIALRTVDLSNNHLHDIRFHNLPNLKEVFVSNNNILKLTNETFINSSSLSVIFLQHNAIQSIDYNTFHSLQHLLTLDLSYNQLKAIDTQLLKHNTRLQSLYLDNNLITDTGLESGTFQELVRIITF